MRYEAVNAMLLNEFIKEHRQVAELAKIAAEQQEQIKALTTGLRKQARQIQKVTEQIAAHRWAPKLVADKR